MIRMMKRNKQQGFTLIELMIVVAIIGILAAVAIPAFLEYMNSGKGTEGDIQINHIEKNAKAYYVKNSSYPLTPSTATPAAACCGNAGKSGVNTCDAAAADWSGGAWKDLKFAMTEDGFRFQYDFDGSAGSGFVAHAIADLDCDKANGGSETTITSTGTSVNGVPAASHVTTGDD
jgi:prepilin-type N-terminal cleavage/methylation domain-containing protein